MTDVYDQIHARKESLSERIPTIMGQIEVDFAPIKPDVEVRLHRVVAENSSRRSKIIKLHALISEVRAVSAKHEACKRGCSACCVQRVMMTQTEADAIGHKIARKPAQLRLTYVLPEIDAYGPTTPCTFLVDNACSIYEHRTFMCRNYTNLDADSLLCGDENWNLQRMNDPRFTGIPTLAAGVLLEAYRHVSGQDAVGDIRDFFPH